MSSLQKYYVFLIIAYIFSSTKLEKRTEQVLPGSEGFVGRRSRWVAGERDGTMHTHINK
jgi:hypothetical protein